MDNQKQQGGTLQGIIGLIIIGASIYGGWWLFSAMTNNDNSQADSSVVTRDDGAIDLVIDNLDPESNGITIQLSSDDLETKPNPKGAGTIVYAPETRYNGTERLYVWVVVDGAAFPVNGASQGQTPGLQWPREDESGKWASTNLSPFIASDLTDYVFNNEEIPDYTSSE